MNTVDSKSKEKSSDGTRKEQRKIKERRVRQSRRDMIRFDKTGGDRRSGNARRSTDEGLRVDPEED